MARKHSQESNLILLKHFVFTLAKHLCAQMPVDLIRKVWCTFLLSLQEVYRWGVGWMMRRRICHSPSRNCGELPLGVSNTKTESHRSQPDRPSPPSPPPCPRRRATATTASTRCPAAYNGSLAYRFTVRRGWACWRLCGLVALETMRFNFGLQAVYFISWVSRQGCCMRRCKAWSMRQTKFYLKIPLQNR